MGFTVSPSNGLKFKRQPLKEVFFYRQPTKMQGNIKGFHKFHCFN